MISKMIAARQDPEFWMKKALELAKRAAEKDEVPVGAILIDSEGRKISEGFNLREHLQTTLAHAEMLAVHRASKKKNSCIYGCNTAANGGFTSWTKTRLLPRIFAR